MAKIRMTAARRKSTEPRRPSSERLKNAMAETAAQYILRSVLGREWKPNREWAGERFDLWNGRDYVAIRFHTALPLQGAERIGKRTLILNFWELEVLEEPEMVAQIIEKAVASR